MITKRVTRSAMKRIKIGDTIKKKPELLDTLTGCVDILTVIFSFLPLDFRLTKIPLVCKSWSWIPLRKLDFRDLKPSNLSKINASQMEKIIKAHKGLNEIQVPSCFSKELTIEKLKMKNLKTVKVFPYRNYIQKFQKLVNELKGHPNVTNVSFSYGPPTLPEKITFARKLYGRDFPPGVEEFYTETSYLQLTWSFADAPSKFDPVGNVNIIPIIDVFNHDKLEGSIWFSDIPDDDDLPLRDIRPFNNFIPEACDVFVVGDDNVHYHYCGEELRRSRMNFKDYIDCVILAKGHYYMLRKGPNGKMVDKLKKNFKYTEDELETFSNMYDIDPDL